MGSIISPPSTGGLIILFSLGPTLDVKKSDVISVLKGNLRLLKSEIQVALPNVKDNMTRFHLQDVSERINQILDPR
jgi:hypothetical protein